MPLIKSLPEICLGLIKDYGATRKIPSKGLPKILEPSRFYTALRTGLGHLLACSRARRMQPEVFGLFQPHSASSGHLRNVSDT